MTRTIRVLESALHERGLHIANIVVEQETDFNYKLIDCHGKPMSDNLKAICATEGNLLLLNPAVTQYVTATDCSYTEVNRFFNSLFVVADQVAMEIDITPGLTHLDTQEQADLWMEFVTSDLFMFRKTAGYFDANLGAEDAQS